MSDQGFREIQLSSKQVVFLFMAGAVALVGTFLLGVSVGQGVGAPEASVKPTPTVALSDQSGALPPATTVAPGVIQYPKTLQEKSEGTPSKPATSTPAATPEPVVKPEATSVPPVRPSVSAPATEPWYIVVDSFSSKGNAERQVTELKAKGFAAKVYIAPGSGAHFKSRLGPFDRQAADAMAARLRKAGYKPSAPIR